MTEMNETSAPNRIPTWVKVVLALSLAGNLAVVGIMAGAALRPEHSRKGPRMMPPPEAAAAIGGAMFRTLDRDERRALRAQANGPYESMSERRLAELAALLEIIRADKLDLAALTAQLAAQRQASDAVRAHLQSVWIARLEQMSVSDRRAIADRVEARVARLRKPPHSDRTPPKQTRDD